jgi:hypothetical protein
VQFLKAIDDYENNLVRLHHSESVLKFWENSKTKYPELYEVATVFIAIPPTQATVERVFSVLGFVYSSRRYNLSQSMLESIILIKMNKDLANEIFEEEMSELN